jgi:hypothetical protein
MSYTLPPAILKAGAPTVNDDSTKGYVVGSSIIDTSVSPRTVYFCTNPAVGAAVWAATSATTNHSLLTSGLGWSASGHTGQTTSIAGFDGSGTAQTIQSTEDGQVLTRVGGVLQFVVMTAALGFVAGRALEIEFIPAETSYLTSEDSTLTGGSFI